jgi:uncharacterized protein
VTEREHDTLVRNLLSTLGGSAENLIQTHISSVMTLGDSVYKLKKPVDFGFLDYSTLARRKHFCEEEMRINSRFAPQLYVGVVPVTGSIEHPVLDGEGEAIEYAVKMRRFDAAARLDIVVARQGLSDDQCDAIADTASAMHDGAVPVDKHSDFGTPERVLVPMLENFDLIASLQEEGKLPRRVAALKAWTLAEHERLSPLLRKRREEGCIRECHGDMHLHNMALYGGKPLLFDAIEFNPYLSHIDVISDLAFLLMDLEYRGLAVQSRRILNRYLERTGDYEAVALLPFYKTYRAMVRAKVLGLHAAQAIPEAERGAIAAEIDRYVALAETYGKPAAAFLAITHGLSGSGKSTVALEVVARFGAVRLRSDIERMRLFRRNGRRKDIYTPDATEATYARLAALAETLLAGGCPVVADATFLKQAYRRRFIALATRLKVPPVVLDITCGETELKRRLRRRTAEKNDVSEADETVLALQARTRDPLGREEAPFVLHLACAETEVAGKLSAFLEGGD